MQQEKLTPLDIAIKKEILTGSYYENFQNAKILNKINAPNATKQWEAAQSILNDIITFNNSLK